MIVTRPGDRAGFYPGFALDHYQLSEGCERRFQDWKRVTHGSGRCIYAPRANQPSPKGVTLTRRPGCRDDCPTLPRSLHSHVPADNPDDAAVTRRAWNGDGSGNAAPGFYLGECPDRPVRADGQAAVAAACGPRAGRV